MKYLTLLIAIIFFTTLLSHAQDQVVGVYHTPNKDGKIEIYKKGQKYYGKITDGDNPGRLDTKNPDKSLRSRKLLGAEILTGFVYAGDNTYEDGKIYDPDSGNTYSCTMTLDKNNNLQVRGYVGISLFGRTETFTRAD